MSVLAAAGSSPGAARAETHKASLTPEAVWAAIDAAQDGDTVQLPAGTAVWSKGWNSGRGAKMKAITIQGAGIDKTIIGDDRAQPDAAPFFLLGVEGKPFRVTGITLDGTGYRNAGNWGRLMTIRGTCKNFRIDHCKFKNTDHMLEIVGDTYGLVDSAKLNEAAELLARTVGADGARELVVIRHGRMIWKGDNIDKRHGVWSATKSFTSTVLGLLIADGKCMLDTHVADVLPELKAHYPDVTLRHFTTMTSGYRAVGDETTGSYKHGPSNTPFVPSAKPLFTPPGSQYAYWDSAMNTLGLALTKIAGEPIERLFMSVSSSPNGT
jgi:hypothetical protein